ncbi:MAG: hypothetical protein HY735_29960 [Verrucomicrobia bacterium]|nr:hypothetical protein [Verrucomicrobiota bacterium]
MTENIVDLWPEFTLTPEMQAPVAFLRQQAPILARKTKNVVTAKVEAVDGGDDMIYSFVLVAPALKGYSFRLFSMVHSKIALYPVNLRSALPDPEKKGFSLTWKAANESELFDAMKEIFNHPKTIEAVNSIIAQSEGFQKKTAQ